MLAASDWPLVWPPPHAVTLRLFPGEDAVLELPVRRARPGLDGRLAFAAPETAEPPAFEVLRPPRRTRTRERDAHRLVVRCESDAGSVSLADTRLVFGGASRDEYAIAPGDPLSAEATSHWSRSLERDHWRARVEAEGRLSCTRDAFRVEAQLRAWEGESSVFERAWSLSIPRDAG